MRHALIALVSSLSLFGCYTAQQLPPPGSPCSNKIGHDDTGNGALVCINRDGKGNITANPDQVRLHNTHDIVLMFSDGSGDLDVQFTADTPIHRHHHVNASPADRATYKATARGITRPNWKKYRIVDRDSGAEQDPDVMIDP